MNEKAEAKGRPHRDRSSSIEELVDNRAVAKALLIVARTIQHDTRVADAKSTTVVVERKEG